MAMEIFTVGRGQEGYPERLMPFADMPSRLFVRGALPADEQKTAAIVGARICTAYGKSQAAFFAQVLAANGVAVISGLACGIDAAAHEGALRGKGKTFAVLGCGVDICYPKQNYPLMRRMLENGGGVLSEFPPGAEPLPWHFPIRNRVISALADVVLVIEAKEKSGSLITADYALEQGKTVFALPGRTTDATSRGCNRLINLGVGLARLGKKVLLVDADPQGDLTTCLGWRDNDSLTTTITDKLSGVIREDHSDPQSGILRHEENVDLLPANIELSAMEMMLVTAMSRETILRSYLSKVKGNYDYVLIDCMPSLGMVTLNALAAADSVIIPVQAQYLPAKGMTQLMQTIGKVRQYINPSLRIDGILLNIVDNRTNLAKSTADALRKNFGSVIKIYRSSIPMAVKAAEVASKGVSIYKYEPSSPVAKAYAEFAKEVSADGRKKERLHSADAR